MPTTAPIDESFFQTAPLTYEKTWDVNQPAEEFWTSLVADRPLAWCRTLNIMWTSPRPFGVGTTRRVRALGVLSANENFFLWEEGRRFAFHFTDLNVPLFKRFGEYYDVEPTGPTTCRFTWQLAGELTQLGRAQKFVVDWLFRGLFRDTTRYISQL
jgi:hypothetical protein